MYWTVGLSMAQLSQVVVLMVMIPTSIFPKGFQKLRRMELKTTSLH